MSQWTLHESYLLNLGPKRGSKENKIIYILFFLATAKVMKGFLLKADFSQALCSKLRYFTLKTVLQMSSYAF